MDPELQINLPDREDDLYNNLFETSFPPATAWFLKGKGIPYHCNENKARLLHLYSASINTPATITTKPPMLPASSTGPITTSTVTHDVPVPASSVSELSHVSSAFLTSLCSQASQSSCAHTSFHPTIPSSTLPSASQQYSFCSPLFFHSQHSSTRAPSSNPKSSTTGWCWWFIPISCHP